MKTAIRKIEAVGRMTVNGCLVEIDPDSLSLDDMLSSPRLFDGFRPCANCRKMFVLCSYGLYCSSCARLGRELEAKRNGRPYVADRIDNGTVEFEELNTEGPASRWCMAVILSGALCSAMFVLAGAWFGFREVIAFCLEHSR